MWVNLSIMIQMILYCKQVQGQAFFQLMFQYKFIIVGVTLARICVESNQFQGTGLTGWKPLRWNSSPLI